MTPARRYRPANDTGTGWVQLELFGSPLWLVSATQDDHSDVGGPENASLTPPRVSVGQSNPNPSPRIRPLTRDQLARADRIARGLCPSCGAHAPALGLRTCQVCLEHDRAYRKKRKEARMRAGYVDTNWEPLRLRFTPRLLPVIGQRYECRRNDDCVDELIEATGGFGPEMQEPPGASCPFICEHFVPVTRWDRGNLWGWWKK